MPPSNLALIMNAGEIINIQEMNKTENVMNLENNAHLSLSLYRYFTYCEQHS